MNVDTISTPGNALRVEFAADVSVPHCLYLNCRPHTIVFTTGLGVLALRISCDENEVSSCALEKIPTETSLIPVIHSSTERAVEIKVC